MVQQALIMQAAANTTTSAMSANSPSASLRPPGQNGPQDANPSTLTSEKRSYLVEWLNSTIGNELPAETQGNVSAKDVAVANDAPDVEYPPTPDSAVLKPGYVYKISVAPVAGWFTLFRSLEYWLILCGIAYQMDRENNGHDAVFVFEGSKKGRSAVERFYKVWDGRAMTATSDSPICALKMKVVKDLTLCGWM